MDISNEKPEPANIQGSYAIIKDVKNFPLVDAHMHIQSNDIAPIPIMFGVAHYMGESSKAKKELEVKVWDADKRKEVKKQKRNYYELSFRALDTEDDIYSVEIGKKIIPTDSSKKAFRTSILNFFTGSTRRSITNATALVTQYGKVARHTSFNIAGIYMDTLLQNSLGVASRRKITDDDSSTIKFSERKRKKIIKAREKTLNNFKEIVSGYYGREKEIVEGAFEFSIVLGMELMYAHYWGAYGIPIYLMLDNKIYFISNDLAYNTAKAAGISITEYCFNAYDIKLNSLLENYRIKIDESKFKHDNNSEFFNHAPAAILPGVEKFKHFLVPAKAEEVVQYEDLKIHLEYTRMAAIKFPFKFLPFYHFDPRRFFNPGINEDLHEFYEQGSYSAKEGNSLIQIGINEIKEKMNTANLTNMMGREELEEELLQTSESGLFWGIKMYAALGCPPYIHEKDERVKIFPYLNEDNQYKNLLDFYKECANNDIPVTCHGSPQGMTIADPGVYLKEYLKRQKKNNNYGQDKVNFPEGWVQYIQGLGLIDDFSSPDSWKIVLEEMKKEYGENVSNKFKLCFAHYGGMGFLSDEFYDDPDPKNSPYCWHKRISKMIKKENQIYTDLSCYALKNIPNLLPSISAREYKEYEKEGFSVIKDIYKYIPGNPRGKSSGHFVLNSGFHLTCDDMKAEVLALRLDMIERNKENLLYKEAWNIANKLAADINENEILRYRIMFGSDWPMSELNVKGVPNYASTMFIILQLTAKLLGNHWDVWHQFAVINPLRFLGLIEDNKEEGTKQTLKFNFVKLERFKKHLEKYIDEEIIGRNELEKNKNKYGLTDSDINTTDENELFLKKYNSLINRYKDKQLPTAHSDFMFNNGKLKLTNGEKK